MGHGHRFECKKCGEEHSLWLGAGWAYPTVFKKLAQEIAEGKHGAELREAYKNTPFAAINAEQKGYICEKCGYWEDGYDYTVYAPNDPATVLENREKWGDNWVPWEMDVRREYHIVEPYHHKCKQCGETMNEIREKHILSLLKILKCPHCRGELEAVGFICWD